MLMKKWHNFDRATAFIGAHCYLSFRNSKAASVSEIMLLWFGSYVCYIEVGSVRFGSSKVIIGSEVYILAFWRSVQFGFFTIIGSVQFEFGSISISTSCNYIRMVRVNTLSGSHIADRHVVSIEIHHNGYTCTSCDIPPAAANRGRYIRCRCMYSV